MLAHGRTTQDGVTDGPDATVDPTAVLDGRVGRPVARNLVTLTGARVVATAMQFVAFASLAATLGPSRLGAYVFAIAVPGLLKLVADFGFQTSAARDVAQEPRHERTLVPNLFYLRLVLGVACFVLVRIALPLIGYDADVRAAAAIAALSLLVVPLEAFRISLEVRLQMGWVAVADVLEATTMVVGVVVLAATHAPLTAFLWLYVSANALNLVVIAGRSLGVARFDWRPDVSRWRPLVRSAAPLGAAGLVIALYYRLDVVILARLRSPGAVGQYGTGYRFLDAFGVLPGLLMTVLNPVLARSVVLGPAVLRRRFVSITHLLTVPAAYVSVCGALLAWRVLPALPGFERYHGAGVALSILSPGGALILLGGVLSGVLINAHLQARLLRISIGVLVFNIVANLVLIPRFSYLGAASATTASELSVVSAQLVVIRRHLGLTWPADRAARVLGAAAVTAAAIVVTYSLPALAQLGVATLVFAVAALASGALQWTDLAALATADGPGAVLVCPSAPVVIHAGGGRGDDVRSDEALVVDEDRARLAWRRLRGASTCRLVSDGRPGDVRFALAARLALCAPVVLDGAAPPPTRRARLLWRLVVDRPPQLGEAAP